MREQVYGSRKATAVSFTVYGMRQRARDAMAQLVAWGQQVAMGSKGRHFERQLRQMVQAQQVVATVALVLSRCIRCSCTARLHTHGGHC